MAETREYWNSRAGFIVAAIGSAVGLGNVWRFPYVCYKYGGGAFLIPYFIALVTTGIPLMILEYGIGQMVAKGAPQVFHSIRKHFEWLGWTAVLLSGVVVFYYSAVMAWCFDYLYHAVSLAWGDDAQTFFFQKSLQITNGPGELGGIVWPIFLGLLLTWISIFLIIYKGVKAVGKVVMITVPLPVLILGIFVLRGVTLPGAADGLAYYLTPDFKALLDPEVWLAAYSQIFFSLSLAFGVLIAYASYLPRNKDTANSAFITSFANCGTSFFAGFAVFSALGFLAHVKGVSVDKVIADGPGLAFITYPTIISNLPFWSIGFGVLFFLMLLTLGIDSAFSLVEGIVAGVADEWHLNKARVTTAVCVVGFAGGIIFTTGAGLYWLDIVDHFILQFGLPVIGIVECIFVGYFFDSKRLRTHINMHSEIKIGLWWDICIKYVTPILLGVMFLKNLYESMKTPYEGYPQWALFVGGWLVVIIIFIGGVVLMKLSKTEGDR
ncbi:sodium-dependent transporter [bacterium]|nr:sodium-dependent transporter [candidate division CSSED10-310 bacterium]